MPACPYLVAVLEVTQLHDGTIPPPLSCLLEVPPVLLDVADGWALEETTGFVTVHASLDGRILAAQVMGPEASSSSR